MKYLKLLDTHSNAEAFASDTLNPMIKPNVSHCVQENDVHYNSHGFSDEYLTFDILSNGTIVWKARTTATTVATISYKVNDGEWINITSSTAGTSFNVSEGDKVMFKGNNSAYAGNRANSNTFGESTASFNISGNIMSLVGGDSFSNITTLESASAFARLFGSAKVVSAEHLVLPATMLSEDCYDSMFFSCTSLTSAPKLPATTLTNSCYWGMFASCTSLTTAPILPATTLVNGCYQSMFKDCSNLNYIKAMFTTTPDAEYTSNWVGNVAGNGTFVKNAAAQWDVTGANGIPSNWSVQTATA